MQGSCGHVHPRPRLAVFRPCFRPHFISTVTIFRCLSYPVTPGWVMLQRRRATRAVFSPHPGEVAVPSPAQTGFPSAPPGPLTPCPPARPRAAPGGRGRRRLPRLRARLPPRRMSGSGGDRAGPRRQQRERRNGSAAYRAGQRSPRLQGTAGEGARPPPGRPSAPPAGPAAGRGEGSGGSGAAPLRPRLRTGGGGRVPRCHPGPRRRRAAVRAAFLGFRAGGGRWEPPGVSGSAGPGGCCWAPAGLGPAGEAERAAAARCGVGPPARPRGAGHRGRGLRSRGPAVASAGRASQARPPPLKPVALNAVKM